MQNEPGIDIADLRKTYRSGLIRRSHVEALRGVSFHVNRGEIFGLLGPNGAGKTTIIKVLLGLVRPSGGSAKLFDRPAGDRQARRRVGYLPEHHRIPLHHTANTALEYYGGLSGLSAREVKSRRDPLLATVGLSKWGTTLVKKFSKGMLQRLGLAQAMLHDPDLLILDEPTDGVDPVGRSEMRDVLKGLQAAGKTVFLNSHLLQEVELVCTRVAILDHGRLKRVGNVEELTLVGGKEVVLTLVGPEAAIRKALDGCEGLSLTQSGDDGWRVGARFHNQSDLDRSIDRLRELRVSISSVVPRRVTLEQAFLDVLSHANEQP